MKYWLIIFLIFISAINVANAQIEPIIRTGPTHNVRMFIVPFDPRIYYNDATPEMAKKYNLSHDELMQYFRVEWNRHLHMAFVDSCYTINLLTDNTRSAQEDLDGLYTSISYTMKDKMQNHPELEEEPNFFKSFFTSLFPKKEKKQNKKQEWESKIENGEIISNRQSTDEKYAHIVFSNKQFLRDLAQRRNIDFFLFINYFEIRGNYVGPYVTGQSNFTRNFKVHFSIFDAEGELIHGGYSLVEIPFDLYNKEEIVNLYFPPAIRQIIHNVDFSY